MTSLIALALVHSSLSAPQANLSSNDSQRLSSREQPPLIIEQSRKLSNFSYNGEIWLKDGDFTLDKVQCKGIRLSRVNSANLTQVTTNGADIGLWIIGGGNVTVKNSIFRNHRVGIEGGPGDPWTWPDEAAMRGIRSSPGSEWKLGMNLGGVLETRGAGISFNGNGTNRVTIPLGMYPTPPYKVDYLPLAGNHWDVTGKANPRVVSETNNSITLEAEGVFASGVKYSAHTYNPNYEIHDISILNSRFERNSLAGVSLYFVNRALIQGNSCPDITSDYEYGMEHARNSMILDNTANASGHSNIRIGLLYRMENIVVRGNSLPLHYAHRNQPELGIISDKPIRYVGEFRSAWVNFGQTINP